MNKIYGKTIFTKQTFHSKVMTRNLCFCEEWTASFRARHKGKKLFFSNQCSELLQNSLHMFP
jgi:hypothetical protein